MLIFILRNYQTLPVPLRGRYIGGFSPCHPPKPVKFLPRYLDSTIKWIWRVFSTEHKKLLWCMARRVEKCSEYWVLIVILCICWDTPSEKTGFCQLPIVSSDFTTKIQRRFVYNTSEVMQIDISFVWKFYNSGKKRECSTNF